jgi:proteasome assembly chaperone (PAC2) family protein
MRRSAYGVAFAADADQALAPGQEVAALPFSWMDHERPAAGGGANPNPNGNHLEWTRTPRLQRPILLAAFEGWNDAGDAASSAVAHIRDRLMAQPFAQLDPEEFFDFTSTRPSIEIVEGHSRRLNWPTTELAANDSLGRGDVVTLLGSEPQLKWRTFCDEIVGVARAIDARLVVVLGALLAEVAHTRPTEVFGTSYDTALADGLGLETSNYEGPTGIVGVLHAACLDAGIPSVSLWASVPSYVPGAPSPKAALALVRAAANLLPIDVPVTDLEIASAAYERQVSRLVSEDEDTATYVSQLESRFDDPDDDEDEELDAEVLVEEVEQFLRNQDS